MATHEALPVTPALTELSTAYSEVLQHNRRHTGFGAAFSAVFKTIATENPTESIDEHLQDGVVEADMDAELQEMFHGDLFMRAGIKLAPLGASLKVEGNSRSSSEALVPVVTNTELFKDLLHAVSTEELEENPDSVGIFIDVAVQLKSMIYLVDTKEQLTDNQRSQAAEISESALRTWDAVSDEYARLGLSATAFKQKIDEISPNLRRFVDGPSTSGVPGDLSQEYQDYLDNNQRYRVFSGIENAVRYWGDGVLSEYIDADKRGLFSIDSRDYYCDGMQDEILKDAEAIVGLMSSPRTIELGLAARDAYRLSVGKTLNKMGLAGPDYWLNFAPPEGRASNRELLEAALARIDATQLPRVI